MTLKDKHAMYIRFQSKMESACYKYVNEIGKQQNPSITISDTFINTKIIPEVWEYIETLVIKHTTD